MKSGYSNRPQTYRPVGGFIFTGSERECRECFAYNGHESWCDKTK